MLLLSFHDMLQLHPSAPHSLRWAFQPSFQVETKKSEVMELLSSTLGANVGCFFDAFWMLFCLSPIHCLTKLSPVEPPGLHQRWCWWDWSTLDDADGHERIREGGGFVSFWMC